MPYAKKKILLVEDEAIIAIQEKRQLEQAGFLVTHARTGEEAVALVSTLPDGVDLVLMDIDLGEGIDGTMAASMILDSFDVPILFLSGHQEEEIVARTESITNYGYVVKHSSFTVLLASIKMAFKLFAAKRQLDLKSLQIEAQNETLRATLSDLEKATKRISSSEAKFSKIFHANPDYIAISRVSDGLYIDVNEGFVRMTGRGKDEVIGKSSVSPELALWANADDRRVFVERLLSEGEVSGYSLELRHKNGSHFWVEASARAIDIEGEKCLIAVAKDITQKKAMEEALRESEQRFRTAFDAAPVAIALTEVTGQLKMVNRAFCRLVGKGPEELKATTFSGITHPDDVAVGKKVAAALIDGRMDSARFEKRYIHEDGHVVWVDVRISLVRDDKARPDYFIAHVTDISERREAEEKLEGTENSLRASGTR